MAEYWIDDKGVRHYYRKFGITPLTAEEEQEGARAVGAVFDAGVFEAEAQRIDAAVAARCDSGVRDVGDTWVNVKDQMPERGVLCVAYFPYGTYRPTGQTMGKMAMAYYHKDERQWVYADSLAELRFEPCYWQAYHDPSIRER